MPCHVLEPAAIPDAIAFDSDRQQYDGDRLLEEVPKYVPSGRQETHVVALTGHDIFGPGTNFVFSWQHLNDREGFGVLSTYRLVTDIPDYYEPDTVATRRVALQALSTTGRMFRFERPTNPECPMAYPESLREFQSKGLRLCKEEEHQRDGLLARVGGPPAPFGSARSEAVARVRRTYYAD